jgi:hypothetical protein
MKRRYVKAEKTRVINYLMRIQDDGEFGKLMKEIELLRIKHGWYSRKSLEILKQNLRFSRII